MKAQTTTSKTNQKLALNKKKSTSANVKILKSDSFYDRNDIQSSVVMVTNESKEERKIGLLANHENISELFKKQNMTMEYYIKKGHDILEQCLKKGKYKKNDFFNEEYFNYRLNLKKEQDKREEEEDEQSDSFSDFDFSNVRSDYKAMAPSKKVIFNKLPHYTKLAQCPESKSLITIQRKFNDKDCNYVSVTSENDKGYRPSPDSRAFINIPYNQLYASADPSYDLHEVVRGNMPRKLFFDIDMEHEKIKSLMKDDEINEWLFNCYVDHGFCDYKKTNDIGKFCDSIVYILIEKYIYGVIELVSLEQYGKYGDRPHVGIFTRHRNSGEKPKNSYHIIVQNYHVLDNINHNKFYTWLKSAFGIKIPDVLFDSGIIDTVGTKKTQNYALPFFTSKGYQLVKSSIWGEVDEKAFERRIEQYNCNFVTYIGNNSTSLFYYTGVTEKPKHKQNNMSDEEMSAETEYCIKMMNLKCPDIMENFEYFKRENNQMYFKRLGSSHCDLCERDHDADHTLFLRLYDNQDGSKTLKRGCWKCKKDNKYMTVEICRFEMDKQNEEQTSEQQTSEQQEKNENQYELYDPYDDIPEQENENQDDETGILDESYDCEFDMIDESYGPNMIDESYDADIPEQENQERKNQKYENQEYNFIGLNDNELDMTVDELKKYIKSDIIDELFNYMIKQHDESSLFYMRKNIEILMKHKHDLIKNSKIYKITNSDIMFYDSSYFPHYQKSTLMHFTSEEPIKCDICGGIGHDNNTVILTYTNQIYPMRGCSRHIVNECYQVRGIVPIGELHNDSNKKEISTKCGGIKFKTVEGKSKGLNYARTKLGRITKNIINGKTKKQNENLDDSVNNILINKYESDKLNDIDPKYPVEILKAEKGIGKTNKVIEYIKKHNPKRVLYVSFRKSLSRNIERRFNIHGFDFKVYLDIKGKINEDRIICQVESLQRVELSKFDLIILDEFEQIIKQFTSSNSNAYRSYVRYESLLNAASKIVIMDADICNESLISIRRIIGDDRQILLQNNTYTKKFNIEYTTCEETIRDHMAYSLYNNKKIIIATNVNKYRDNELVEYLKKCRYPLHHRGWSKEEHLRRCKESEPKILLYTEETLSKQNVKDTLTDVNSTWVNYDVVIYSPSIQSGVSFEKEHFDEVYGIFTNNTNSYLDCSQMLHRVRCLATADNGTKTKPNYHVCIIEKFYGYKPIKIEEIEKYIEYERSDIILPSSVGRKESLEGEKTKLTYINKDNFYYDYIESLRKKHISETLFMSSLIGREYAAGGIPSVMEYMDIEDVKEYKKVRKAGVQTEKLKESSTLSNVIIDKCKSREEMKVLELRKLYNYYGPTGEHGCNHWFVQYNDTKAKNAFLQLSYMCEGLDELKARQFATREGNIETDNDTTYTYVYRKHKVIQMMLEAIGFDDIFDDKKYKINDDFNEMLIELEKYINKTSDKIAQLFNKDKRRCQVNNLDLTKMIKWLNPVLISTYGASIKTNATKKTKATYYYIDHKYYKNLFYKKSDDVDVDKSKRINLYQPGSEHFDLDKYRSMTAFSEDEIQEMADIASN